MALGQHAWCVCQPPNHGDLAAWRPWGLLPWGGGTVGGWGVWCVLTSCAHRMSIFKVGVYASSKKILTHLR